MRTVKLSALFLLFVSVLLVNGCGSELKDLRIQNDIQRKKIADLQAELRVSEMQLDKLKRQLTDALESNSVEADTLLAKIKALEGDLANKKNLIASMQQKLLYGAALPPELSTKLEEFAKDNEIVTFDSSRGIVKFKSDLLFKSGSDEVLPAAADAVKSLCKILNEEGKAFDIIIAGHTDDQPIRYSRAKHPTNWHLSSHRGISVLNIMTANGIDPKRLSERAFGEFRPVVDNKPDKQGHPQNRRVEIYIVPAGT